MRYFFLLITLLSFSFCSKAADYYTSVKSSLHETINNGFNVQLIDANTQGYYLLFQVASPNTFKEEFAQLRNTLMQQGYRLNYHEDSQGYQLLVKVPKDNVDTTIQQFFEEFEEQRFSGLELIILGAINQQRLLGVVNRQFNAAEISISPPEQVTVNGYSVLLTPIESEIRKKTESDWMVALGAALLNCSYTSNGYVLFSYVQQSFSCKEYAPNYSLTDKEVVNLKDNLHSNIQVSVESAEGFLQYIGSFKSERRLEQSQVFLNSLPNLSIDDIVEYHYKKILKSESEASPTVATIDKVTSYQLPDLYKVKSSFDYSSSKVVNFDIAIDNSYTCVQLNCHSLGALSYIDYSQSENMHFFSMQFPSIHETSIIGELNKVLFIPLSTSSRITQENIFVSLSGGYLLEAYDESFQLLAKLPLVKTSLNVNQLHMSEQNRLTFKTSKERESSLSVILSAIPGGEYWEESELYYFILLNLLKVSDSRFKLNKANTLVNLTHPTLVYLELNSSPIYVRFDHLVPSDAEPNLNSLIDQINDLSNSLSRNEFVEYKKGLLTNLKLLDAKSESVRQLSHLFDMDAPQILLSRRLESLSYEQFQSYLNNNVIFSHIVITTFYELDETFKSKLIESLVISP